MYNYAAPRHSAGSKIVVWPQPDTATELVNQPTQPSRPVDRVPASRAADPLEPRNARLARLFTRTSASSRGAALTPSRDVDLGTSVRDRRACPNCTSSAASARSIGLAEASRLDGKVGPSGRITTDRLVAEAVAHRAGDRPVPRRQQAASTRKERVLTGGSRIIGLRRFRWRAYSRITSA